MPMSITYVHLDTADRRGLSNIGKFDVRNLWLALSQGIKYLWLLLTRQPEVVYVPISQAWLPFLRDCLFLIPARLLRRKVVVHLHGGYFGVFFSKTTFVMRSIIRFSLSRVACAIVLGRAVEQTFDGVVPADRIRIIPNAIPDPVKNSGAINGGMQWRTVLFLSTLMAEKGVLDALSSMELANRRVGPIRSVFAGEWYSAIDEQRAKDILSRFPSGSKPEFIGAVGPDRKHELLATSSVFVFPTFYPFEGHPFVLLEAMAFGLPVISTKWACIPEIVEDGVNGFLVEPRDVDALAERICTLLVDDELRRKMGQASRDRFVQEFSFEKFALSMQQVFSDAMGSVHQLRRTQSA